MKKIYKFILKTFLGPFFLTFAVVEFILLLVNIVKYMEEISGKDLGFVIYTKLFGYFALNIVPSALPLAILLSSLITYGSLGEHRELTAIKSAGISLVKILKPIFLFSIIATVGLFYYSENVIPWANLKLYSLLYDIKQKKPTLELKEGAFYTGLPGYRIRISEKSKDGKSIKDVMVYDHSEGRGNDNVVLADSGQMYTILDDRYLVMDLYNGSSFTELNQKVNSSKNIQIVRSNFKKSKIVLSLEAFAFERTQEDLFKGHKLMKNIDELKTSSDSIKLDFMAARQSLDEKIMSFFRYHQVNADSVQVPTTLNKVNTDSLFEKMNKNTKVTSAAIQRARSIKSFCTSNSFRINNMLREQKRHDIELWKKFAVPFSCVMLFLIGAPLGAIIKKGGLGIPVLISIFFFIILYVIGEQGRKWSLYSDMQVWFGMWLSNFVLMPFALFFLYQAKNDTNILELDYWKNLMKRLLFLKN